MLNLAGRLWPRRQLQGTRVFCSRPLVLLQSDDWGRVGVRDEEGAALLRTGGVSLGERPYDFYTLETADDVIALRDLLKRHRDSTGRCACLGMNFVMANLDFAKMAAGGFEQIHLLALTDGLPGKWSRPGLFNAYRQGVADEVFYPALHGLTHFCRAPVEDEIIRNGKRRDLLRTLWEADTPYIHWRMPWVGYEYCNPEKPRRGFLTAEMQTGMVQEAASLFATFFDMPPVSACAPGYRANRDTRLAWSKCGVRVAQNGSGTSLPSYMDEWGILNLYRTIDFEPSLQELPLETYMQLAEDSFARGVPAIISVHAINFHSSLKDFRGPTLRALDRFLSALERKYPDLLYIHDADMYEIVTQGRFRSANGVVSVAIQQGDGTKSRSSARSTK